MKVWVVAETDGYDSFTIKAVYDNEEAAELHSLAIDEESGSGLDYGYIEEHDLQSSYRF